MRSPVLHWPGKRVPELPQLPKVHMLETFTPGGQDMHEERARFANALFHGDNLLATAHLLKNGLAGRVRLIYADPPYDSGVTWTSKVRPRLPKRAGVAPVLEVRPQYVDLWQGDDYLQFMYDRLHAWRALLADDGSLWLHCDYRRAHHLRCLLEEIFGAENYLNTITWRSQTARGAKVKAFYFPNSAHTILVFARNRAAPTCWNPPKKRLVLREAEAAAEFMRDERGFFRTSDPGTYSFASLRQLHAAGRLYAPYGGAILVDEERQRVFASNGGNIGVKYYLTDLGDGRHVVERAVDNVWDDIPGLGTTPGEDLGYPTQKTAALLERIVATATRPGDLVFDPFVGSGTTLAVAHRLGRRWIGCDAARGAIQTTTRRMQAILQERWQETFLEAGSFQEGVGHQLSVAALAAGETFLEAASFQEGVTPLLPPIEVSITRISEEPARIQVCLTGSPVLLPGAGGERQLVDWRAVVDSIVIDPAYDGAVLRATFADAPQRKQDQVRGDYELPAPVQPTTVAVRLLDIAGGELLVTRRI